MDRLLRHHLCFGYDSEAHQPVAAQDVRQGADAVGDELKEVEQWQHWQWDHQQQDPTGDVGVRSAGDSALLQLRKNLFIFLVTTKAASSFKF